MGLDRLVLVAPQRFPHADAIAMAAGADDVLEAALRVQTLAEAVADCRLVLGCTARSRRVPLEELSPRAAASRAPAAALAGTEVALASGRERTAPENDELPLSTAAAHITANPDATLIDLADRVHVLAHPR